MNNGDSAALSTFIEELRNLHQVVGELEGAFRQQREQLKRKGMSLPPGTLQGIQTIATELDAVAGELEGASNELTQLRALRQTAELINSTLNLDELLNYVMTEAIQLTRAERGYLVLRDKESGGLTFRVARNMTGNLSEREFTVSRSVVQEVANTGNPVLSDNAQKDARWVNNDSVFDLRLISVLCVPLLLRGEVTGVIYADNRIFNGNFGEKEKQLLEAFANQAAVAIENARLFESARASLAEATAVKALMDNVFASIASGVIAADTQRTVTTLNDAAEQILSISRTEWLGQSLHSILPPIDDTLEDTVQAMLSEPTQQTATIEARPTLPGRSTPSILNLKFSPLRNAARLTQGVTLVIDDLTESRRREEQIRAIRRYLTPAMVDNIQDIDGLGLGGERREVTIVFIDVRDFSAFPAALKPVELMRLLNQYLTVAVESLSRYEGIIDKYMANEIMALFNTQLNPNPDHAIRAVRAALRMADDYLSRFYPQVGELPGACYYRIGIHTGVATLGNTGSATRKEFTAIGDTINLAHRLLEHAAPGQIILSRETYQHCSPALAAYPDLQLIERGEIHVKGRQQLVSTYEAVSTVRVQS